MEQWVFVLSFCLNFYFRIFLIVKILLTYSNIIQRLISKVLTEKIRWKFIEKPSEDLLKIEVGDREKENPETWKCFEDMKS